MRPATIISLGASTALGVGALIVARLWMPNHVANAQAPAAPPPQGVPVVVAAQPIPYGVKLEAKYLTVVKLPPGAAPTGAYSSVNQILSQQGGPPTSLTPMQAQEPVLASKLTGVGERATLAALITPGMRAYTIAINEVSGTGGHVMPGDRVDVVLTRDISSALDTSGSAQRRLMSNIVSQNLRVLGVDQNANPTTAAPIVAHSATLEVSVQDAERLALAAQSGTLSLALRKTGASEIEQVRPVQAADLGPAGAAALRGPVGGRHRAAGAAQGGGPRDEGPSVIIVNGDAIAKVKVPADGVRAGFL
ncbi:MAG: Flp pilus assembly protein CpaB [Caulobacteraceae bacterium]|nr:Flp pilus assembly protein CpaB [Caulobacteraceae bacterium]